MNLADNRNQKISHIYVAPDVRFQMALDEYRRMLAHLAENACRFNRQVRETKK